MDFFNALLLELNCNCKRGGYKQAKITSSKDT